MHKQHHRIRPSFGASESKCTGAAKAVYKIRLGADHKTHQQVQQGTKTRDGDVPSSNEEHGEIFLGFSIRSFPRAQNWLADNLAKAAAQQEPLAADVFFETLKQGSVNCAEEPAKFVNAISNEDWRATIMAYLHGHFIPEDEKEEK